MRTDTATRCRACGASWDRATARFCGRCGDVLLPGPQPGAGRRSRFSRGGRQLMGLAVVVAAALVTGSVLLRPSGAPSDEVELSRPPSAPEADADAAASLAPEAAAPSAPAVSGPVHCTPPGCERWRRPLPTSTATVAGADGFVAVHAGEALEVVDAATGELRWSAPTGGPARDGTATVAFDPPVALAAGHGVVVATGGRGWVQAREAADGALRWSTSAGWRVGSVALAGDGVVVVASQPAADTARRRLRALHAADGQELWDAEVDQLVAVHDGQLLAVVGAVTRSLEPTTGEVRFETDGRAVPFGPWLAVDDGAFTRLVDPDDGRALTVLQGLAHAGPVRLGDAWAVVVAAPPRPWANPFRPWAMGLDGDGQVRWMFELDGDVADCCVLTPWAAEGTGLMASVGGDVGYVMDGTTGRVLQRLEPSPIVVTGRAAEDGTWAATGDGQLTLQGAAGTVHVVGGVELVHDQPPVALGADALVGLRLVGQGQHHRPFRGAR